MNPKHTFFLVLIVAAATGGGFWLGERHSRKTLPTAEEKSPAPGAATAAAGSRLPPVKSRPVSASRASAAGGEGTLSVAEIEAKLLGLRENDRRRGREFQKLIDAINPADIPHLLSVIETHASKMMRDGLRNALLSRLAETDPQGAMAYANNVAGKLPREQAIMAVLRGWADKDPDGAAAWAQQLQAGPLRAQAINVVANAMAATNPQAAFDLAQAQGSGSRQWGSMWSIFNAWADKDPQAAAARAAEIGNMQQRSQAFQAIGSVWAAKDPQAALAWASGLPGGNDKRNVINSIVS